MLSDTDDESVPKRSSDRRLNLNQHIVDKEIGSLIADLEVFSEIVSEDAASDLRHAAYIVRGAVEKMKNEHQFAHLRV